MNTIKNNMYFFKLAWKISPLRVFVDFFVSGLAIFQWYFLTILFIQFIVNSIENYSSFEPIAIFLLIATAFFAISSLISNWYNERFLPMSNCLLYEELNKILFTQASNVDLSCFEEAEFYNAYTLAAQEANDRILSVLKNVSNILFLFVAIIAVLGAMISIDRFVVLFAIFPFIATFVFSKKMNRNYYEMELQKAPHIRKQRYVDRVVYLKSYSSDLRLYPIYNVLHKHLMHSAGQIIGIIERYKIEMSFLNATRFQFTFTFLYEGVVLYSAYMTLIRGTMTLGEFAILATAMKTAVWMLSDLTNYMSETIKSGIFIQNFKAFMDYEPAIPEDQDGESPGGFATLELKNVCFKYKNYRNAGHETGHENGEKKNTKENTLDNISLKITNNETIAIVGHNGAGKTTLTKLLTRLYDPSEGEILLNGTNIKELNLKEYRALFSSACQDFNIFAMSVAENVLLNKMTNPLTSPLTNSLTSPLADSLTESLKKSGIYDKITSLKNGVHTTLTREFDDEGVVLSGGEYQKIAIARAFSRDFEIAIFDEPSSALDPISEHHLFETMKSHCLGKALIFISHRLSSTVNADRIYVFDQGKIIEEGDHTSLMALEGKYFEMFTKQAEKYMTDMPSIPNVDENEDRTNDRKLSSQYDF